MQSQSLHHEWFDHRGDKKHQHGKNIMCLKHQSFLNSMITFSMTRKQGEHSLSFSFLLGTRCNRDCAQIGPAHPGRISIPSPPIDLYCLMVPCLFCLIAKSTEMPKSCSVVGCTTNKAKHSQQQAVRCCRLTLTASLPSGHVFRIWCDTLCL